MIKRMKFYLTASSFFYSQKQKNNTDFIKNYERNGSQKIESCNVYAA